MKKLIMYFKKKDELIIEILALRRTINQITEINHELAEKIEEVK